ncbi:MAG: glycosyltransferase [Gemmatimonadales bacterium]|nr:glycosyltransferase [Gemmatimonadales bacterium]
MSELSAPGRTPLLSVILPCFRAAGVAKESVTAIGAFLSNASFEWEVVVVDDGGHDFPGSALPTDSHVTLVQLQQNRGKGAAVRAGMASARGAVRIFTDVDLPFGVRAFPMIMEYILTYGFHLVIGDRTMPQSRYRLEIPRMRRAASAIFSTFVGRIVTGGYYDTQCGLKGVRGDVADAIFPLLRVDGFAFDVELIYLALKSKADIKRIPVVLETNTSSSVRLFRDGCHGCVDIARIKLNEAAGRYASKELSLLLASDIHANAARAAQRW